MIPLYLPIETKARELHAKLLLAATAAASGFPVIVGAIGEMKRLLPILPAGILLYKSVPERFAVQFRYFRSCGHRIVAWDEEGLVFHDPEMYLRQRVSADSALQLDRFHAWGEVQADAVLRKVPQIRDRIRLSGNTRVDVLRDEFRQVFADDTRAILDRYGEFILVNTNFSIYNHFHGPDGRLRIWKQQGKIRGEADEAVFRRWVSFKASVFESFKDVVTQLARRYPQRRIIVRPHPSENHDTWRGHAASLSNVEVVYSGSAVPWLMAARVLIHNGCTTGVEAYVLGRPVIAYRPVRSKEFDHELPNMLSANAYDPDEVSLLVDQAWNEGGGERFSLDAARRLRAGMFIANLEGRFAADRMVDDLLELQDELEGMNPGFGTGVRLRRWLRGGRRSIRRLVAAGRNDAARDDSSSYQRQKFPGLDAEEILDCVRLLDQKCNRFGMLVVRPVEGSRTCYRLTRT